MRRRALVAAVLAGIGGGVRPAPSAIEAARIERLIAFVAGQKRVAFIRNGSAYSGAEAAQFLRAKYEKMGEHVTTAAQFIEQIATRSSTTGEAYLIRLADGRTVTAARFLGDELQRIDRPQ